MAPFLYHGQMRPMPMPDEISEELKLAGLTYEQYRDEFSPCQDCSNLEEGVGAVVVWDKTFQLQEIQVSCDLKGWVCTKDNRDCREFIGANNPS